MIGWRKTPPKGQIISFLLASASVFAAPAAWAQDQSARIAALEAQVNLLMQEIQSMKAEQVQQSRQIRKVAAAPAQVPAQAPVQVPVTAAQGVAVAEATGVPVSMQGALRTPPSPGVAGHPFYGPLPDGRETNVMATGNANVRLTFSGQINRALNTVDDGKSTDVYQVDNENASSRFRFLGESNALDETQALALFEFEWPVNGSLDVNQIDQTVPDSINKTFNLRLLEVGLSNNTYGSFFIGQGWMASDGTSEMDITGVTTPLWSGQTFAFGGMLPTVNGEDFDYIKRRAAPDPGDFASEEEYEQALGDYAVASSNFVNVFTLGNNLDGLSRLVRVRYNTPVWNGFQLSGSAGTEDRYDVALRYAGETDWARMAAGASWWTDASSGGFDGVSASGSMVLKSDQWWNGVGFAAQYAKMSFDDLDNEPTTWMGKLTYTRSFWDIGRTGFALQYSKYEDFWIEGADFKLYGVGFSQNIDRLGSEAYAGVTQNEFTVPGYDVNDMTLYQIGLMVRF